MADFASILGSLDNDTNKYVDSLISDAQGDRDFIVKQLAREHELALGKDDVARAQFLEAVADKLEERIGYIPYDYQRDVSRTNQDLSEFERISTANKDKVLSRLAEDEQIYKDTFNKQATEARGLQQEDLLKRGVLQGTRAEAGGIAGKEVTNFEQNLQDKLAAYDRELSRTRTDTNTQYNEDLLKARRDTARTLEDLKTKARRGATEAQDTYSFGVESADRRLQAQKNALERQRSTMQKQATAGAASLYGSYLNG